MKTVWNLNQFFHQNEPKFWAMVGNISFIAGLVAGLPAVADQFGVPLPLVLVNWSTKCAFFLVGVKWFSKNFGTVDAQGKPVDVCLTTKEPAEKVE